MYYNTYNILGTAKARDWNSSFYANYSKKKICILNLDKKKQRESPTHINIIRINEIQIKVFGAIFQEKKL